MSDPRGLLVVHTGNGKGKSTAAFGLAFRAMGQGLKVSILQFIKGKWKTGELESAPHEPGTNPDGKRLHMGKQ